MIVKKAYPHNWPNVFDQLVQVIQESDQSLPFLTFTFSVLEQINDVVIEREAYTTNEDLA